MLHLLYSTLNQGGTRLPFALDEEWVQSHQVIGVMTGGSEARFLELLQDGTLTLDEPVYIIAGNDSNSLAASMEILSYINQHHGHGEIRLNR